MKWRVLAMLAMLSGAALLWMTGCEMPWESDDDDNDAVGSSTIQGNVADFVATAKAANREGIVVYLDGPVDKETTTGADGIFVFSGLPVGSYTLRFKYNGEEVRYRGNSGQELTITLEADQRVELTGIRISGGVVNIGNIRYVDLVPVSKSRDSSDDDETTSTNSTATATSPASVPAKMTIQLGRGA